MTVFCFYIDYLRLQSEELFSFGFIFFFGDQAFFEHFLIFFEVAYSSDGGIGIRLERCNRFWSDYYLVYFILDKYRRNEGDENGKNQADRGEVGLYAFLFCQLIYKSCGLIRPIDGVEGNENIKKKLACRITLGFVFYGIGEACGSVYPHKKPNSEGKEHENYVLSERYEIFV